jgi:GNAT superfamily N-acetyltransferase
MDIRETGWAPWNAEFKRHHYLPDAGPMGYSTAYTGFVDGEPVFFIGISGMVTGKGKREARVCRMVVKPEWQGAGVGMAGLEWVCERELRGHGFIGKPTTTIMHSAHPALAVSLRRNPKWRQISQRLVGDKKDGTTGMGGHLRSVQGFRYVGQAGIEALARKEK